MGGSDSLLLDLYELTMAEGYLEFKPDTLATFDLFLREMPRNRSYFVAAGLEDVLDYIENLKFDAASLDYLHSRRIFSHKFLDYLKNFKFRGDIHALPEGTIVFSGEPILRVTANIIEAQIIESYLLNTVNFQTMIATKALRVASVAGGREVFDFSLRRTHGKDAGVKAARAAYLGGFNGTSCVLAGRLYGIPVVGTMAHSYVMSFKSELASFRAYSRVFPKKTILLIDTYDTENGIENAVIIGKELEKKGCRLSGIRLDSGDIVVLSKLARKRLDRSGLNFVKIFASGNLDEYKIRQLLDDGAKIDSFGVGTSVGVSSDAPYLDGIYKISEVTDVSGAFLPTMKLSRGKVTYPGRKQVFRVKNKKGEYVRDILGLEDEKIEGEALLVKAVDKGRIVYKRLPLEQIRQYCRENFSHLPARYKELRAKDKYPVEISPGLKGLTERLKQELS